MTSRDVTKRYDDPVDLVWVRLVNTLDMTLSRTDAAYATYDGRGGMALSVVEEMDPDDCIAQMVLHELCHALVQGRRGLTTVDWNLPCEEGQGLMAEYAAQRLQAHLADTVGMREFFAVTTQWRPHWDALDATPIPSHRPDQPPTCESAAMAARGLENARAWGWEAPILRALESTAQIAEAVRPWLEPHAEPQSLWRGATGRHPQTGFPYPVNQRRSTCGECGWAASRRGEESPLPGEVYCLQAEVSVTASERACRRFDRPLAADACGTCGACCREAFDEVEVEPSDAIWQAPANVVAKVSSNEGRHALSRPEGRCGLLNGDGDQSLFRCTAYAWRPRSCREFTLGSRNCLFARQRVGLSANR